MSGLRIEQPMVQPGFVAEEQETFGIRIEAAQRIHPWRETEFSGVNWESTP